MPSTASPSHALLNHSIPAVDLNACADQVLAALQTEFTGCGSGYGATDILQMRSRLDDFGSNPPNSMPTETTWPTSHSGSAIQLPTLDSWLVLNRARDDDESLLSAWIETPSPLGWHEVAEFLTSRPTKHWVERGRVLGLPVAPLGPERRVENWAQFAPAGKANRTYPDTPLVVDLSSLWAGPLCSHLLQQAGLQVIKVESQHRPDPSQTHLPNFYAQLHQGKTTRSINFHSEQGRRELRALVDQADVLIEGSRPRALAQLGFDPTEFLGDAKRPALVAVYHRLWSR